MIFRFNRLAEVPVVSILETTTADGKNISAIAKPDQSSVTVGAQ
jgi:hypothetical protein